MAMNTLLRRKCPFWLQILLILLCGAILSVSVLLVMHGTKNTSPTQQSETQTGTVTEIKNGPLKEYTVSFAWQDGTVIDKRTVKEGHGVFPPELDTEQVFRGWSGSINRVKQDIEVHPMLYHISMDENLFYFNSQYVKEGETFTIDINLAGIVNISEATLEISYDPEVMEPQGHTETAYCTVEETEPGLLTLELNSETVLREKTLLSSITFLALEKDVRSTQISLSCKNPTLMTARGEIPATGTTINNEIFYLQEVD